MKINSIKKAISVVMTGAILLGFTGCLDLGGDKKAVIEAADTLASDMISASASKLIKNSTLDKKSDEAAALTELLDGASASDDQKEFFKAFEGAVEYEVDEESCSVKKGEATIDIVFSMPDYASVLDEDFTDIGEVTSAIKKAKTKDFTFTAEFVQEDKEWLPDNVGSKKFMKFYDYRNAEIELALTPDMISDLIDFSMSGFWMVDSDGTYTDTTFIEYDLYFDSKVYNYENRGQNLYFKLSKDGEQIYQSDNFLLGQSTTIPCRVESDMVNLGIFAYFPAGTYTVDIYTAEGVAILSTSVNVKETPAQTGGGSGSGDAPTFDGEGEYFDFYDKSFKSYVIDAGWFDYDGYMIDDSTYSSSVETIGFSVQVTADCNKKLDYFYGYTASDTREGINEALENPVYVNSASPKQYDNGYFYDLDYDVDGGAQPGIYIIVVTESGTSNYILYGYCQVV